MSRLIVKNLPNKVTVENLREVFGQKGEVTDVQLKYTKDGQFRNFGFIGYRTEEQAATAREYFDGTCIKSMKIQVEVCANLGDGKKPRAWSKYAHDSSAFQKSHPKEEIKKEKEKKKIKKNKNKILELLKKHKDDPLFAEFIEAHVNEKSLWIKEALEEVSKGDKINSDDENEKGNDDVEEISKSVNTPKVSEKHADKPISDLEYMQLLMKKVDRSSSDQPVESTSEEKPKKIRNRPLFVLKVNGLPFKCKKKDIKDFFRPLVPFSIRLPLGKGKKVAGFCYVGFRTEAELKKALNKDKLFLGNHRVHLREYEDKAKKNAEEDQNISEKIDKKQISEETIGESGSIFVRNLPYVLSEQELTSLFEKYGPLADVNMPIDPVLRQPKGFATVTFMIPEHAVKAFTELDGTAFCGRMLHLLPGKTEKIEVESDEDGLTFKEKKARKLKAGAKSSHNWNTLFLDTNAVADVIAANYDTTKEQLLTDTNTNTSAAVRLALGETQLVAETKAFLESNGVYLEAFNNQAKKRSKTCILVKNLPANTEKKDIQALFEKHGQIARCLMPKHGITALVDFIEPFEAKKAFTKLAYSQFKTVPLYLEWAPENVFGIPTDKTKENETNRQKSENENKIDQKTLIKENDSITEDNNQVALQEEHLEPENNTTLFVKNLNFKTTENTLLAHFSGCGKVHSATIAKKKDLKNNGKMLSMGYGFVRYYKKEHANEALKLLQNSTLEDKKLELKRSERGNTDSDKSIRKGNKNNQQNGTKVLVRNVPFQANRNELHEIFRAFGEIKSLRLPKKLTPGSDQHRGFAFVDYHSKADAKTAFQSLSQSTHLYGRRLVLEWADQDDENENIDVLRKRMADTYNAPTPGGKKSRKAAVDVETFVDDEK